MELQRYVESCRFSYNFNVKMKNKAITRAEKMKYDSINSALLQRLKRRRDDEKVVENKLDMANHLSVLSEELTKIFSKAQLKAFHKEIE